MSGHSVAVEMPVARLRLQARTNSGRALAPASITTAARTNSGGPFFNKPFAALARTPAGKAGK